MFAHFDRILELNDVFISNKNTNSNLDMCMHAICTFDIQETWKCSKYSDQTQVSCTL